MTALATPGRQIVSMGTGPLPRKFGGWLIADNVSILKGAHVSYDPATNYVQPFVTGTGLLSAGVAVMNYDNTVTDHAAAALTVETEGAVFPFANSSAGDAIALDDIGKVCYAVDDATVALTSNGGTRSPAGIIAFVDSVGVWVFVGPFGAAMAASRLDSALRADLASVVALFGTALVGSEDAAGRFAGTTAEAQLQDLGARVLLASASETTIKAIPAAARTDGTLIVDLTNNVVWQFDAGSAAGASAWVLVPDAGTGRWLRNQPSLADLSSTSATLGAALVGYDGGTTVKAALDAGMTVLKKTLTSDHTTLVAAAATETVNIGTALPANSRIVGVDMHTQTSFSGGTISDFTVDVGTAGDVDALVDGADLFAAAVDGGPAGMTPGIRPNKFLAAGGQLVATFRCGSDDVADASAGAITIDVLYTILA